VKSGGTGGAAPAEEKTTAAQTAATTKNDMKKVRKYSSISRLLRVRACLLVLLSVVKSLSLLASRYGNSVLHTDSPYIISRANLSNYYNSTFVKIQQAPSLLLKNF
jgi:hypothetical protein